MAAGRWLMSIFVLIFFCFFSNLKKWTPKKVCEQPASSQPASS